MVLIFVGSTQKIYEVFKLFILLFLTIFSGHNKSKKYYNLIFILVAFNY